MPRQAMLVELFHEWIRIKLFYIPNTRLLPETFEEHHRTNHSRYTCGITYTLHACFEVCLMMAAIIVDIISTFLSVFCSTDTATNTCLTFIVLTKILWVR